MNILNNIFKVVEPAASQIITSIGKELFMEKSKEEVKKDYIQPILTQVVNTASTVAVNHLKKIENTSSLNLSEYEIAKQEKYSYNF